MSSSTPAFLVLKEDFRDGDGETVFKMLSYIAQKRNTSVVLCVSEDDRHLSMIDKFEIAKDGLTAVQIPLRADVLHKPNPGYLPLHLQSKEMVKDKSGKSIEQWKDVFKPMDDMLVYRAMTEHVRKGVIASTMTQFHSQTLNLFATREALDVFWCAYPSIPLIESSEQVEVSALTPPTPPPATPHSQVVRSAASSKVRVQVKRHGDTESESKEEEDEEESDEEEGGSSMKPSFSVFQPLEKKFTFPNALYRCGTPPKHAPTCQEIMTKQPIPLTLGKSGQAESVSSEGAKMESDSDENSEEEEGGQEKSPAISDEEESGSDSMPSNRSNKRMKTAETSKAKKGKVKPPMRTSMLPPRIAAVAVSSKIKEGLKLLKNPRSKQDEKIVYNKPPSTFGISKNVPLDQKRDLMRKERQRVMQLQAHSDGAAESPKRNKKKESEDEEEMLEEEPRNNRVVAKESRKKKK